MRRRGATPVEVTFYTDPLCPWSWAMERTVAVLRTREDLTLRSVLTGWLPSLAARGPEAVQNEWRGAAAKTRVRLDAEYWDRVAPKTGLIADAAVKAAGFQGTTKGEAYLAAMRRAVFDKDLDVSDPEALATLGASADLRVEMFRGDLGVGRYTADDVVASLDPVAALAESVSWFGRRKMLRSWETLAEDLRDAERQKLTSPTFRVLSGKKEAVLKGVVSEDQVLAAVAHL